MRRAAPRDLRDLLRRPTREQNNAVTAIAQELHARFTPANGDPPRPATLRIGTPVRAQHSWSTQVKIEVAGTVADTDARGFPRRNPKVPVRPHQTAASR